MAVESATYIQSLNASWPAPGDPVKEGYQHLGLVKSVLKATFPNATAAYTATPAVVNGLDARVVTLETSTVRTSGAQSISGSLNVTGKLKEGGTDLIPYGVIVMWTGASPPSGWALCNGTLGTPNLVDRFVVGAGSSYGVGAQGGATAVYAETSTNGSHGHSTDGQGSHNHGGPVTPTALSVAQMPYHAHSGWTDAQGDHSHTVGWWSAPDQGGGGRQYLVPSFNGGTPDGVGVAGLHAHNIGISAEGGSGAHDHYIYWDGYHGHNVSVDPGHLHGVTIATLPPYYALAYIMKL